MYIFSILFVSHEKCIIYLLPTLPIGNMFLVMLVGIHLMVYNFMVPKKILLGFFGLALLLYFGYTYLYKKDKVLK
jgi:hypothetical protein